jgi:hypothetical protein
MTQRLPEIKFVIGDKTFLSKAWPTKTKAFKNLPTIGKAFAVPISFLFSSGGSQEALSQAIPQAMYMLFEQLEEQDINKLLDIILEEVYVMDPAPRLVDVDNDLQDLGDLLELLAKVLQQHYGKLVSGKGLRNLFSILVPMAEMTQA